MNERMRKDGAIVMCLTNWLQLSNMRVTHFRRILHSFIFLYFCLLHLRGNIAFDAVYPSPHCPILALSNSRTRASV